MNCNYRFNEVDLTDRYIARLGIPGDHYYIKVRMDHLDGKINVVDFVLVNFDLKTNESQLDSIWVEDLIDLLSEHVPFIFDESKYEKECNVIHRITKKPRDIHFILNDLRVIFKLLTLGITPGSKGVQSELKRKIRSLYFYHLYYVNEDPEKLYEEIRDIGKIYNIDESIISVLLAELQKVVQNYNDSLEFVNKNNVDSKMATNTYGIPAENYGFQMSNWKSEYNF